MIHKRLCTVLLLGLAPMGAWAQSPVPTPANGEGASLALQSERAGTNVLIGSLSVGTLFDDNVLSTNANHLSDLSYLVRTSIAFEQSRPRLRWSLTYSPGFSVHQRLPGHGLLTHALGVNLQYRATRRLTVRFRDSLSITTNPFDRLDEDLFMPAFGVLDRPNDSVATPLAKRIGNQAGLDLSYQLGPRKVVGASGSFSDVRFRDLPGGPDGDRLIDTRSTRGRAFYVDRVSQHHSVGAMYNFLNMSFSGDARTINHSVSYFHSILLKPSMMLSIFAGPEYSRTHDQVVLAVNLFGFIVPFTVSTLDTVWSLAGGITYSWRGSQTSFRANFVRQISDGGGRLGVARVHNVRAELRRRLTPSWIADIAVAYADSQALILDQFSAAIQNVSGTVRLTHRLREDLSLALAYSRVHQDEQGDLLGERVADHNRFTVILAYHFSHPLGR